MSPKPFPVAFRIFLALVSMSRIVVDPVSVQDVCTFALLCVGLPVSVVSSSSPSCILSRVFISTVLSSVCLSVCVWQQSAPHLVAQCLPPLFSRLSLCLSVLAICLHRFMCVPLATGVGPSICQSRQAGSKRILCFLFSLSVLLVVRRRRKMFGEHVNICCCCVIHTC